ncbi:MAG TPA: cyclopropane fatty acyl phospholipid synthase [Kofleriaceae bacterium]|nr:cyclopropane fatty acyl phospholipid synthase [Kofleriaceae bacterium]
MRSPSPSSFEAVSPRSAAPAASRWRRARDHVAAAIVERTLASADIRIDGDRAWDVRVADDRFFTDVLLRGALGAGESYMAGWWDCHDLEELARRVLVSDVEARFAALPIYVVPAILARLRNDQSVTRSRRVADQHYSMDNDLFCRFLGQYRMYSAGYFEGSDPDDLDEAQRRKLDLICRKLELSGADHLLDVGGGWGELARYAAATYGCRVTSINISDEQIRFARDYCRGLPVEIVKCDYRYIQGRFDKIAAIAMFPHVGYKNHREFIRIMRDHLAPEGLLLIESTAKNVSRTHMDPWVDRYFFPGALFPSVRQIGAAIDGMFVVEDWQNFWSSYIHTLRAWNRNFQSSWPELSTRYPESTRRMFEYFFLTGAGGFHARLLNYWHVLLAPLTRRRPAPQLR